jgi:hypothetical protein
MAFFEGGMNEEIFCGFFGLGPDDWFRRFRLSCANVFLQQRRKKKRDTPHIF